MSRRPSRSWLRAWFSSPSSRTERSRRPRLEVLEDRLAPAITLAGTPTWFDQGPGPMINAQLTVPPNDPASGAIHSIAIHPNQATHMIVGSVAGGVWRTTNADPANPAAIVWAPVSDTLATLSIGAVAYDTADATGNTFYAGAGDFSNSFDNAGQPVGLYRTTDAGASWTLLGALQAGGNQLAGLQIKSIVVLGNTILVGGVNPFAGSRDYRVLGGALFRSTDGGATFTQEVGAGATDLPNGAVTSVVQDPNNAMRVFVGVPGQGIFRSDDAGDIWTPVNTGLTNLATCTTIEMATQNNAGVTTVYASISTGNTLDNVFSTTNGGTNWNALAGALPAGFIAGQNFAEKVQIIADPDAPGVVYLAGQAGGGGEIFRYNPAAMNWTAITGANANNTTPHVDSHDMMFLGNNTLLYGSDGGIYYLRSPDNIGANTWLSFNGTVANQSIRAIEFFSVAYNPNAHLIIGGSQDNGTEIQMATNGQIWDHIQNGDGSTQEFDGVNNIRYSMGNNYGNFTRNGTQIQFRPPGGGGANFDGLVLADRPIAGQFNGFNAHIPFVLNAVDPTRMLLGRVGLYESVVGPATGDEISTITPAGMGTARSLAYGGRRGGANFANVAFVGTSGGQVFFRGEAGAAFTNVSDGGQGELANTGSIEDIVVDPQDWRRVFLVSGDRIWTTNDVTDLVNNPFNEITDNLDQLSNDIRTVELFDVTPATAGDSILLAGGLGGVYRRLGVIAGGCADGTWSEYGTQLPNIVVQEIRFANVDIDANAANGVGRLIAATMGRGAYTVDEVSATIAVAGVLTVTGDGNANAMELREDPTNPQRIIVSDGAGLTQAFDKSIFQRVEFFGLAGADTIRIDSNGGTAAGSTVNFVTFLVSADGGGNAGDALFLDDFSDNDDTISTFADLAADTLTITATTIGNDTDTYFGACGRVAYTGFQLGGVQIDLGTLGDTVNLLGSHAGDMTIDGNDGGELFDVANAANTLDDIAGVVTFNGNAGIDFLNLVDQGSAAAQTYNLSNTQFARVGGPTVNYATLEFFNLVGGAGANTYLISSTGATTQTIINDGDGGSTFTISGDGLTGQNSFLGNGGNDTFTLNAGTGVTGDSVLLSGGANTDVATFNGRAIDDTITQTLTNITGAGNIAGLGQRIDFDTLEQTDIDGQGGGGNRFTFVDDTGLSFGTVLAPETGIVYKPTAADAGTITINTGLVFPVVNFRAINGPDGAFAINGTPAANPGQRDVLTVLGASTNGLGSPFNELTTANGSDIITVTDTLVTLTNAAAGVLRSVALAESFGAVTFFAMVLRAGNEAPPFGDTVTATPSNRMNLFLDGMDPACGKPGDKLTVLVDPNDRSVILSTDPVLGPPHARIVRNSDGASVGFIHFETVAGTGIVAVAPDFGPSHVRVFDAVTNVERFSFLAYPGFGGGVRVAVGDVNGDGIPDIVTGIGPGAQPHIKVFDGISGALIASFFAFHGVYSGGIHVAVADTNCDGHGDIIVGSATGFSHVKVINGVMIDQVQPDGMISDTALLASFYVYSPVFQGGVTVAGGDFNGDGIGDVITGAGPGAGPHVKVIDGTKFGQVQPNGEIANSALFASFFAFLNDNRGGVFVAAGDVDGDFFADIIVGHGSGEQPEVAVYHGKDLAFVALFRVHDIGILRDPVLINSPPSTFTATGAVPLESGVRVAVADKEGKGDSVQIVAVKGPGTIPRVRFVRVVGLAEVDNYLAFAASFPGGLFVGGS